MNDTFVRKQLNVLTGLTRYQTATGSTINITGAWDVLYAPTPAVLTDHIIIAAYGISVTATTGTITSASMRILATKEALFDSNLPSADKIFPYSDEIEVTSGISETLNIPIQIPYGYRYRIEIKVVATGAATAILDHLSYVTAPQYSYS